MTIMARNTTNPNARTERRERTALRPTVPGGATPGIEGMLGDLFSIDPQPARRATRTAPLPMAAPGTDMAGAAAPGLLAASRIDTPDGPRTAGTLREGDLVMTGAGYAAPLVWVGRNHLSMSDMAGELAPVHIAAGALGPNNPRHAVVVAARQMVRLTGSQARFCYGESEVFVAAADLVNDRSIRQVATPASVTIVHLLVAGAEDLTAEQMTVESFLPTPGNIEALSPAARAGLLARMPELKLMTGGASPTYMS